MSQTDLKLYRKDEKAKSYIPLGSARGCKQTLEPVAHTQTFRTIAGNLISLTGCSHQKFISHIECDDIYPVSFDNLWPGVILWVECISRIITPFIEEGGKTKLMRPHIKNSLLLHKEDGTTLPLEDKDAKDNEGFTVQLEKNQGYISYRPLLCMMMKKFSIKTNEWERIIGWNMQLEEV